MKRPGPDRRRFQVVASLRENRAVVALARIFLGTEVNCHRILVSESSSCVRAGSCQHVTPSFAMGLGAVLVFLCTSNSRL